MITALSIQVQPGRFAATNVDRVKEAFGQIVRLPIVVRHDFSEGHDKVRYLNFTFGTHDVRELWREIQERIYADAELGPVMASTSMAMCEGSHGWDDYLLLYHFDPAVPRQSWQ